MRRDGIVRLDRAPCAKDRRRLVEFAREVQRTAELPVREGVLRIELEHAPVRGNGLGSKPALPQRIAKTEVRVDHAGRALDGAA